MYNSAFSAEKIHRVQSAEAAAAVVRARAELQAANSTRNERTDEFASADAAAADAFVPRDDMWMASDAEIFMSNFTRDAATAAGLLLAESESRLHLANSSYSTSIHAANSAAKTLVESVERMEFCASLLEEAVLDTMRADHQMVQANLPGLSQVRILDAHNAANACYKSNNNCANE